MITNQDGQRTAGDTIAAIATALSEAGIGIVRISGEEAIPIADKIVADKKGAHTLSARAANTIRFCFVVDETGAMVDEALVSVMKAPYSYTGEDVVEINTHGGRLLLEKTLSLALRAGARLAAPGEFTKRAFLNGKMDLTKAEAAQDLIAAQNSFALKNAQLQMSGALFSQIDDLRKTLLHETAFIEAALDDPDVYGEELEGYGARLTRVLDEAIGRVDALLATVETGRRLKDGLRTAILGKPNAGKSTLLNLLTNADRAIVTAVAGTTRDMIEETILLGDTTLHLMDTAGIRASADVVEKIGVERAKQAAKDAEICILLLDVSVSGTELRRDLDELLPLVENKRAVVALNKTDLVDDTVCREAKETIESALTDGGRNDAVLLTCLKTGDGVTELKEAIKTMIADDACVAQTEYYLTNARHIASLNDARNSLCLTKDGVERGATEDLFLSDLLDAYRALSEIIGETVTDDLADEIFSSFCMGK